MLCQQAMPRFWKIASVHAYNTTNSKEGFTKKKR